MTQWMLSASLKVSIETMVGYDYNFLLNKQSDSLRYTGSWMRNMVMDVGDFSFLDIMQIHRCMDENYGSEGRSERGGASAF